MTGSMIERSPRTTSSSVSAGSAGPRSRYATLVVRGLIVAGFTGVVWLMSSSAAHASDEPASMPQGAAVRGLFSTADHQRVGSGVADAVSGEAHARGRGHRHVRVADLESDASDLFASIVPMSSTIPVEDVTTRHRSSRDPVSHLLTGTDTLHHVPGSGAHPGGLTVTAPATRTSRTTSTARAVLTAPTGGPATSVVAAGAGGASEKDLRGKDGAVPRRAVNRHIAGGGTTSSGSRESFGSQRTRHVPLLPRPAPDPAIPGAGLTSGVPGMGSGPSQDGGAPAVPPATTAASVMAGNRPDTADDVEVRTLITEPPTVSPD